MSTKPINPNHPDVKRMSYYRAKLESKLSDFNAAFLMADCGDAETARREAHDLLDLLLDQQMTVMRKIQSGEL